MVFGLGSVFSKLSDNLELDKTNTSDGTPEPGTSDRDNISLCLYNRAEKNCVTSTSTEETKGLIAIFTKMIFENKNLISEPSYNEIFKSSNNVYTAMDAFQKNEPGAVEFFTNTSLFQEASGGSEVEKWSQATITPNPVEPQPVGTPEIISINPELHLYVPQIEKDLNGDIIKNVKNFDSIGTYIHEIYHLYLGLKNWNLTGTFTSQDLPYITEKYQGEIHLEEYQAEFYGDVAKMCLFKANNLTDEYYKENEILELTGVDLPSVAYYMDSKGVKPENSLWAFIYDNLSSNSIKFNENMYKLTGNEDYRTEAERIKLKWQSYNWSEEEINFIRQMEIDGINEGWILPDTIPQLSEPISSTDVDSNLWMELFKTLELAS